MTALPTGEAVKPIITGLRTLASEDAKYRGATWEICTKAADTLESLAGSAAPSADVDARRFGGRLSPEEMSALRLADVCFLHLGANDPDEVAGWITEARALAKSAAPRAGAAPLEYVCRVHHRCATCGGSGTVPSPPESTHHE